MTSVERNVINRKHTTYCVTNVPKKDFIKRRINAQSDSEFQFPEWSLIKKQLLKIRFDFLIKNLPKAKEGEAIDKRCLANLFRAIGSKILPSLMSDKENLQGDKL